ncbi:MAG: bifunctional folylpolyglutamate synthase/dihydrofolate synthase [Desulfotalea sp.]
MPSYNEKKLEISSYNEALKYLDSLQFHKIKLGLKPMRDFLQLIDNPEEQMKIVHVAGTNGKGSVCSAILQVMQDAGYHVGLYTSPHLTSPRERFRIGDRYISKKDFTRLTGKICEILNGRPITYFEFTTSLALLWFYEQKVDLVVLETGLGGRLDATNVVKTPIVTIITSVSMDHEAYLGTTLTQVAGEKSGIIKDGVPVISASTEKDVLAVVTEKAKAHGAKLYQYGKDFYGEILVGRSWKYHDLENNISMDLLSCKPGRASVENNAVVLKALDILASSGFAISDNVKMERIANLKWPGRLEMIKDSSRGDYSYLLDGAHNPAGIESLIDALSYYKYNNLICIWGAMNDKDISSGINMLAPLCESIVLTAAGSERSASVEDIQNLLAPSLQKNCFLSVSVDDALEIAENCYSDGDLILVAGSLFLIGEIRPLLVGGLI